VTRLRRLHSGVHQAGRGAACGVARGGYRLFWL